jgi:hypothetical protein
VNGINLIPAPRRLAAAKRRHLRRWIIGCLGFAVILVALCTASHMIWCGEFETLDEGINATTEQIKGSSKAIQRLSRQLADAQWKLESCLAVGKQPDWSIPLAMVAGKLGEEVVLEQCELKPRKNADGQGGDDAGSGRYVFRVTGLGKTQTAVSQFVLRLEKSDLFNRVRLIKTNRQPFLSGKAVQFQLECLLEGKGGATG